jgi:hypothetical protein
MHCLLQELHDKQAVNLDPAPTIDRKIEANLGGASGGGGDSPLVRRFLAAEAAMLARF